MQLSICQNVARWVAFHAKLRRALLRFPGFQTSLQPAEAWPQISSPLRTHCSRHSHATGEILRSPAHATRICGSG
eukprot:2470489-Prymnesium_polylepis.1